MKIAYFTNQYPKVSHSFIRREIRALEGLGLEVLRFSIRDNPEELVDGGANGWLIAAGSVESLVAAMKKSLSSKSAQLIKMGLAGREAVSRRHNSDIEAKKLANLFTHALNSTTEEIL